MRHAARISVPFVAGLFVAVMLYGVPAGAANEFEPAKPHGKIAGCPRGAFPDISRKIGRVECWKCPKGFNRTVPFFAIDGDHACEGPREFKRARQRAKATQGPVPFLKTDCLKDQFLHYDGYCYSCPDGFERTVVPITPITSRQACSRPVYASAAQRPDAGCPEGTFLDIGRGDCWSCPDRWYRTVNPVDSRKACSRTVANIFAVDSTAMCTQFLKALREGEAGAKRLMTTLAKTVEPLMQPVQGLMGTFNQQMATPAELDRLVDRLAEGLRPHVSIVDELQRLSNQMEKNRDRVQGLLLNPKVMCEGSLATLDRELIALELRPDRRSGQSGWLDDLLIGKAHAATKGTYVSVFLSFVLPIPPATPVPNSLVLMGITNFAGDGGFYWSLGRSWSTELRPSKLLEMLKGVSVSGGMHVFPNTDSDDFLGINALALELSFGPTGEKREQLLRKLGAKKWLVPDNFVVSVDPLFWEGKTFPLGFGFSWTRAGRKPGQISSASPSGTVPIPVPPTPRPSRTLDETSSSASPSGTVPIPTPRQSILDVNFSVDFTAPLRPPWQ